MDWLWNLLSNIPGSILGLVEKVSDFTGDLFWDFATSPPVLIGLALLAVAAFLVAHVPAVATLIPWVAAWQRLAILAQFGAAIALIFLLGFRVADDRAEMERVKNDLAFSEFQLDQQRQVADEADRLKSVAEARAQQAESTLNEYPQKFGKSAACEPPAGYLDWLHTLQRRTQRAGADQPQRGLVARVRAFGRTGRAPARGGAS